MAYGSDVSVRRSENAGRSFSTDNSCPFAAIKDQQGPGLDPKLGPLTIDPLGITFYHMPQADSPLLNAAAAGCTDRDQRYALRPNACDIGAVEFGGLAFRVYTPLLLK